MTNNSAHLRYLSVSLTADLQFLKLEHHCIDIVDFWKCANCFERHYLKKKIIVSYDLKINHKGQAKIKEHQNLTPSYFSKSRHSF